MSKLEEEIKVSKRRDTCVLPGEVNPDLVVKGDAGEKICYYTKCVDCGRDDRIVFHPCIHQWICFNCKKAFGGVSSIENPEQVGIKNSNEQLEIKKDTQGFMAICPP